MKYAILLFGLLTLFSCAEDKPEPRGGHAILSHDQMVEIVYELGLVEASWRSRLHEDTAAKTNVEKRIQVTLNKYNVPLAQYDSSLHYYMENPKLLVDVYDDVLARYSTKIAETEEAVEE